MKISEVILERIKHNHALDAYVKGAVARVANHISSNTMVFFPEYTDHDISHFEAVLETAVDLATEKSMDLMTDVDLAILTTSVMLHDLGMHLSKDGFKTLVDPDGPMRPISGFDDVPWHELWQSFLSEARRFDAKKLEDLFGPNYQPVTTFPSFDDPWNEFDYLLVGEFLRRHHPRLAHEIALHGMPAKDGAVISFCSVNDSTELFVSDISGLVARSHGMSLRHTFPYLERNYNNVIETRSSHPIYLMVLLRVADYLQIQSARAPSARTDVSKLKSPVSTREWSVHQCVTDINNIADPEAIDITAKPEDVETFLRLKYWLTDLQKELDTSWAVLGEVYGLQAHSGLNKLGLRIRRLRSNIDSLSDFAKSVDYIPKQIAFTTAGSDLLKLLVGPLYANQVYVGLRELIQNATDAVKELDSLVDQGSVENIEKRSDISSDVQVDFVTDGDGISLWNRKVTEISITDRGVGMTSEILQNYFLKAGASFRSSNAWKAKFEKSDGSSRVQRSGRFGVGALAAFLLGDEISVETRHYSESSPNGLKFSAGIETSSINVARGNCEVGTKIRIEVPERLQTSVGQLLPFGRKPQVGKQNGIGEYFGTYPELTYTVDGSQLPWDEKCLLPAQNTAFQDPWNYFEARDFEVNWTYADGAVGLAVNQIRISGKGNQYYSGRSSEAGVNLRSGIFSEPCLSVGDNSGAFALNLQRSTYAASSLPFSAELMQEITDEFLFNCIWQMATNGTDVFPRYSGLKSKSYGKTEPRWLNCSDGIVLNEQQFLKQYDPSFCFCRHGGPSDFRRFQGVLEALPSKSIYLHDGESDFIQRKFKMKGRVSRVLQGEAIEFVEKVTIAQTVFVPNAFVDLIRRDMKPGKDALKLLDNLRPDGLDGWSVQSAGAVSEPQGVRDWRADLERDGKNTCVVSLHRLSTQSFSVKESNDKIVLDRWMELIEQPYIPREASELAELQSLLSGKLGSKYEVFERRMKAAERKKAENSQNAD